MKEVRNIIDKYTVRLNNMKADRALADEEKWTDAQVQECDNQIRLLASILSDLNKVVPKESSDTKNKEVIQLFLDAEEELRNGNDDKCLELKAQFQEELKHLSDKDKQYVREYLEDLGA